MRIAIYNNKNEKVYFNPTWASHLCLNKPEEYSRTKFDLTHNKKEEKSESVEEPKVRKTRKKRTSKNKED